MNAARTLLTASLVLPGCYTGDAPSVPRPSYDEFRADIYPLLLRDCGFNLCHGNPDRYYQVFGPGRMRLSDDVELLDDATEEEIEHSYDRARAMLLTRSNVMATPLLRKPLEGGGHAGLDDDGRNVYATPEDPDFVRLAEWAQGLEGDGQ